MRQDTLEIFPFHFQKLFGGLSMACDFADLVQNGFCTRPVALLQGAFEPRSCTSPAVSRRNIHPPNSFSRCQMGSPSPRRVPRKS